MMVERNSEGKDTRRKELLLKKHFDSQQASKS